MGVPGLRRQAQECGIRKRWHLATNGSCQEDWPLVVDGNALAYFAYYRADPWIYGGDTTAFRRELGGIMNQLQKVFPRIHIVMDGPKQKAKWPLSMRRAHEVIRRVRYAFERSGGGDGRGGGGGGGGGEYGVLSPLYLAWSVEYYGELAAAMPAHISFTVSWLNADREIAQWAMQNRAWIVSNDSDFFVYAGHAGYLPLEDFGFPAPGKGSFDDDNNNNNNVGDGDDDRGELCAIAYHSKDIANRFSLPVSLLPLLVSLAGNDYTVVTTSATTNSSKSLKALAQEIRALFPRRKTPNSPSTTDPHIVLEAYAKRYRISAERVDQVRLSMAQYELTDHGESEPGGPADTEMEKWASLGTDISYRWMDVVRYGRFWCTPVVANLALPSLWLFFRPLRCLCYQMLEVERVQEVIRMERQVVEQWVDVTRFEADPATVRWIEQAESYQLNPGMSLVDQFLVLALRYMVVRQHELPFVLNDLDLLSLLFCSRASVLPPLTSPTTTTPSTLAALATTSTMVLLQDDIPLASLSNCTLFSAFLLAIEHTVCVLRFLAAVRRRPNESAAFHALRLTSIPVAGKALHVVRSRLKGGTPWTTFLPDLQAQAHIRSLYAKITDGCEIETVFR